MAKASYTKEKGIFGRTGDFDVDMDGEHCGVIGGEMSDRDTVGPVWDWRPDESAARPAQGPRVLGQLDQGEFHTAREGSK